MSYLYFSWKNIAARPLSSGLSALLLGLGILLVALLLHAGKLAESTLQRHTQGVEMVLGAKGSPLQLILSSLFQIDDPTGNIPLKEAQRVAQSPLVQYAIPLLYGDSYGGMRLVGTTTAFADLHGATLAQGRSFQQPFEVAAGYLAAQKLGLQVGSTFYSQHGIEGEAHEHPFTVVGILQPSGSVADKLLLTPQESVWESHHGQEEKEITALLVKFKGPGGLLQVPRYINEKTSMQAAIPSYEVFRLMEVMGAGIALVHWIAACIIAVAGLSMGIALYNSLQERKHEMALLRTFGAPPSRLALLVLQEGIIITLAGFALGMAMSRVGLALLSSMLEQRYGYRIDGYLFLEEEGLLLLAALGIGAVASLLPSWQAFRMPIAKVLAEGL